MSNCTNLIRCLPQLQRDEKDPNDTANEPHEITHAPDAIRYWCAARPCPTVIRKTIKPGWYDETELQDKGYSKAEIARLKRTHYKGGQIYVSGR